MKAGCVNCEMKTIYYKHFTKIKPSSIMKLNLSRLQNVVGKICLTLLIGVGASFLFNNGLLAQVPVDSFDAGKGVDSKTYTNLTTFTQGIEWVYGFLVIVTGYLSVYIPFFKNINKGVYRILAVAAVLGAGFYFGAGANLINLFITYTVSTSFYEVILKLLKKEKTDDVVAG